MLFTNFSVFGKKRLINKSVQTCSTSEFTLSGNTFIQILLTSQHHVSSCKGHLLGK